MDQNQTNGIANVPTAQPQADLVVPAQNAVDPLNQDPQGEARPGGVPGFIGDLLARVDALFDIIITDRIIDFQDRIIDFQEAVAQYQRRR